MMSALTQFAELEDLEIQLLLEGVHRYYGFDFRSYAIAAIKQRIGALLQAEQLSSISRLQEKILHEPAYLERFLLNLSPSPPGLFRDPIFYQTFRMQVVPLLRTYPSIRMALLLWEENLYQRCRIYATDFNETLVLKAKAGVFALKQMQHDAVLYQQAGGKRNFSDYYAVSYDNAILHSYLKEHLIFATHNLVTDASFNEFNVIICRNVLGSFNSQLQVRVHRLFHDSLARFGILGLGPRETLKRSP
jgi:chemotaxis protein methyltransferase CheR